MIRVVVVEDNIEYSQGICKLISESDGFECVGAYSNAETAFTSLQETFFDVAIVDVHLGGQTGIELIRLLKPILPDKEFIIHTVFEDSDTIFDALKSGANGYLLKNTPSAKILESIREVTTGGSPMSSNIARKVISAFTERVKSKTKAPQPLSKRETEILELLSRGYRYKEIGNMLCISTETVRTHIRNIYQKLQVNNGIEAINKFFGNDINMK
jgi:DNA-binding NarL/FixJ family response regulator